MHAQDGPLAIAHVTGERGFSGGEVQVFLLIRELARRGHRNTLLCPPGSRSEQEARRLGIETFPVPMRVSLSPLAIARARRALRRAAPDLVHLHTGRANWVGGIAAATLSLPAITTRRMDRRVRPGPRTRWLYRRGVRHAVAISPAVRARLLAGGVPAERTRVIPSAVDPEALQATRSRAEVRAELGVDDDAHCCLLALARLTRRKGIDVLLDALARLDPCPTLWIAGDGEERASLEARRDQLGLSTVRFLGTREDKACLLQACDVFVMPSRAEGLGVAALEAMACGRPVVASRVGGLADLLDEATGRLVPPDDAAALADGLEALVRDPALRQRLGSAGPARVRQGHLPAQMAAAYESLYRDVLEGKVA